MRSLCIARLVAICVPLWAGRAGAYDLDASTYSNRQLGVKLTVAEGWSMHRETGYPSILLLLLHQDDRVSISLAYGDLKPDQNLEKFVGHNLKGLQLAGLRPSPVTSKKMAGRSIWLLDAKTSSGAVSIRQIYQLHGRRVLILTLSCPAGQLKRHELELVQVLEEMELSQVQSQGPSEAFERPRPAGIPPPGKKPSTMPAPSPQDPSGPELDEAGPELDEAGPELDERP